MRPHLTTFLLTALFTASGEASSGQSPNPVTDSEWKLENGIRMVVLTIPDSKNVSIFSFLPLGLASDAAGKTQWSHLVEHLVLRTTHPGPIRQSNGETLADHMRLEFYGNIENWREGLKAHVNWLQGIRFTGKSVETEKYRVVQETKNVARRLAAYKFAFGAWAQGYRHGLDHAAMIEDIRNAKVADIQAYRDNRLVVLDKVVVCVVGGVDAKAVKAVAAERLAKIKSDARVAAVKRTFPGDREMTWDLDARHLLMTWPIPGPGSDEFPAFLVTARILMKRVYQDAELKQLTGGVTLAGADLSTPEGQFLYVSCSLRPGAAIDSVKERVKFHLNAVRSDPMSLAAAPMLAWGLAHSLTHPPDIQAAKAQAPLYVSALAVEMNAGLQWGMNRYRYGDGLPALAKQLSALNAERCIALVKKYLADEKCSSCTIRPVSQQQGLPSSSRIQQMARPIGTTRGWWSHRQAGWIGAIAGSAFGCIGGTVGILIGRGKARRFVLASLVILPLLGAGGLVLGFIAVAMSQPWAVYYGPLLLGLLLVVIPLSQRRAARKRYEQLELRKMQAMDA